MATIPHFRDEPTYLVFECIACQLVHWVAQKSSAQRRHLPQLKN
jgi:hypothetical protein